MLWIWRHKLSSWFLNSTGRTLVEDSSSITPTPLVGETCNPPTIVAVEEAEHSKEGIDLIKDAIWTYVTQSLDDLSKGHFSTNPDDLSDSPLKITGPVPQRKNNNNSGIALSTIKDGRSPNL